MDKVNVYTKSIPYEVAERACREAKANRAKESELKKQKVRGA